MSGELRTALTAGERRAAGSTLKSHLWDRRGQIMTTPITLAYTYWPLNDGLGSHKHSAWTMSFNPQQPYLTDKETGAQRC